MEQTKEDFFALNTREDVANLLGISDKSLRYFLYAVKPDNMYYEFAIEKKSGGQRKICAPYRELKNIQRKLADVLNCVYRVKPATHGFVNDKDIVTNAKNHIKRHYVLNIDLEDFFDQINFGRVRGMLLKPPYEIGEEAATVIAQIACYKGRLPQGAPSSPIITNMICAPLDTQLTKLAKKYKLRYSRYADDITFSSYKNEMPAGIVKVLSEGVIIGDELANIINKNGFSINISKTRMFDWRKRQEVTGLVVNRFVNIRRSYIKEIRAILYHCGESGIYEAAKKYIAKGKCKNPNVLSWIENENEENIERVEQWFISVLKGKLEFVKHVKGENNLVFLKYAKELNELSGEMVFDVDEGMRLHSQIEKSVYIIQNKDETIQGSGFVLKGVGLLTNDHVTEDGDFYNVITYKGDNIMTISTGLNLIKNNKDIDYAVFQCDTSSHEAFELGDSSKLGLESKVTMIGYPEYVKGNSPDIQEVKITSTRSYMGQTVYIVSGRVIHGASGGVVLDDENKVVGIIRCGAVSYEASLDYPVQGFIPINDVVEDMKE